MFENFQESDRNSSKCVYFSSSLVLNLLHDLISGSGSFLLTLKMENMAMRVGRLGVGLRNLRGYDISVTYLENGQTREMQFDPVSACVLKPS